MTGTGSPAARLSCFHIYFLVGCLGPAISAGGIENDREPKRNEAGAMDDAATAIANARRLIDAAAAVIIWRR